MSRPRRYRNSWQQPAAPKRSLNRCCALLVIDNRPLQTAAWEDLVRARKRLEKATRDLHRHEEIDEPAFRAWLANNFPTLISAVRTLAQQIEDKARIVQVVQNEAFFTGRSPARIWREWQQAGGRPPEPPQSEENENEFEPPPPDSPEDAEAAFDQEMKRLFSEDGIDEDDPLAGAFRNAAQEIFGFGGARHEGPEARDARAIYRRLVQHLHPDRGGEWTPARARLWAQVQEAWSTRDNDWLARLEAEWEASTDLLGPTSAVGRLRAALTEIDAARRDAERRVRTYRKHEAWRFSLQPPSEILRRQLERHLRQDEASLRRQLDELERTIATWTKPRGRGRQPDRQTVQYNFGF